MNYNSGLTEPPHLLSVTNMKNVTPNNAQAIVPAQAWAAVVAFHGHACPGLALGCRLAMAGLNALHLDASFCDKAQAATPYFRSPFSPDEELVCVAETDACGLDAFQVLLGCTMGKGNLILKPRGKNAFTLYHRPTGQAVRLLWTDSFNADQPMSREERIAHFLSGPAEQLYTVTPSAWAPPSRAVISASLICSVCGEPTAEFAVRRLGGQYFCRDCFPDPSRII